MSGGYVSSVSSSINSFFYDRDGMQFLHIRSSNPPSVKQFNATRTKETEINIFGSRVGCLLPIRSTLCFSKETASQPWSGMMLHRLSFCKVKGLSNSRCSIRILTHTSNTPKSASESPFAFRYPRSCSLQLFSVASGGIDK